MRVLQTLFNQPSRSYAVTETATATEQTAESEEAQERAVRRSQYYSAAQDPRLRKEWERMLTASQQQQSRQRRHRKHLSTGAVTTIRPPNSPATANLPTTPSILVHPVNTDDEHDEFFTPQSSPQVSPQTLVQDSSVPASPLFAIAASEASHRPSSKSTPSERSDSYAPSVATSSDQHTDYSWGGRSPGSEYTNTTLTSSSRSSRHSRHKTEPGYAASSVSSMQQEGWAKDFRWLVPPEGSSPHPAKRAYSSPSPSTVSVSSLSSRQSPSSKTGRSKTEPIRPRPRRKMSEIQEEDVEDGGMNDVASLHDEASQGFDPSSQHQVTGFGELLPVRRKSQNRGQSKRPKSLGTYSESASSSVSNRTVDLPTLVPHTEPTTYTSIVFPRAGYQPSKHPERITNAVDIVQQGVASTTMSTISVTKHAAEVLRTRRLSLPRRFKSGHDNLSDTPSHLKNEDSFVGLSSNTPTPSKVQANQLLVQVFCVALEGLDVLLTREKAKTVDGYGFVPGRGFSGKIVEVGYEVMNLRRGDWVMGLLDVSKCGALSEFVLVDRRRVHRAPVPTPTFSAEHLAVLAVSGVAAHRAVNTLPGPLKDSRVLVLQGHDGAGALAVQELCAAGAGEVTVQVPSPELLEKLRGVKIKAVKVGTPIDVLNSLEEDSIDAIIDTVGGRELWLTCKRLFGSTGQFTTILGDVPEAVMSKNAHVKSNMRSLKLAFTSSKKAIGYEWVSASAEVDNEGKDLRDSLAATCGLASEGSIRPRITPSFIIPFEKAPDVFNDTQPGNISDALLQGSVAVIRLTQ